MLPLVFCLSITPLSQGVASAPCFVMCMQFLSGPFQFCNHFAEEKRVVCFTLIIFLLSSG